MSDEAAAIYELYKIGEETVILENKGTEELCECPKTDEILSLFGEEINAAINPECHEENDASDRKWSENATKELIYLYKDNEVKFKSNTIRNDQVWNVISSELKNQNLNYSPKQCMNKWKHLRKLYLRMVDNMGPKGTGESPKHFQYFNDLDEIFSDKPNVVPLAIASSSKGAPIDIHSSLKRKSNGEDGPAKPSKTSRNDLLKWFDERDVRKEELRNQRHDERMNMQRTALSELKDIVKMCLEKRD